MASVPDCSFRARSGLWLLLWATAACAAGPDPRLARAAKAADDFQRNAPRLTTTEVLHQTSYNQPPHAVITVGASPPYIESRFITHNIVSEYTFGQLKGSPPSALLEFRELVSMDGRTIQTPAVAQRALLEDATSGEERIRKHILAEFTQLGLVDVATDYGPILLAFTTAGLAELTTTPAGEAYIGTEETLRFDWAQNSGGALEFRGSKVARRPLHGSIWIRKADGLPLRIFASVEHRETRHTLRDDATIDYVVPALGFPTPVTVCHRHFVDDRALTENLYSYEPFHLFTTDTTIHYTPPAK